jgi:Fe-Mn family superoxide dismutase
MIRYELPSVPYSYDALAPHIDAKTMEIHHTKHHQTYINNLNAALEKCPLEIQNKDTLEILSNLYQVPNDVKGAINFNGCGFDNHRIFWNNFSSNGGGEPKRRNFGCNKQFFWKLCQFQRKVFIFHYSNTRERLGMVSI